jgi:hypothetical protein
MRRVDPSYASTFLLSALVATASIGCNRGGTPEGATGPAASGSAAAAPAGSAVAAPGPVAEAPVKPQASGKIAVAIKDFQLFHPYSPERAMPNVRDNGTWSTRESTQAYGLGVIVEATNDTGEVLHGVWLEGTLRFVNGDREVSCRFSPDSVGEYFNTTYTLHYNDVPADAKTDPFTGEKPTAWRNESGSTTESVWRPGERIRLISRKNECDSLLLADMPPSQVKGRLIVRAGKRFVKTIGSEFDSGPFELALVGDSVRILDKATSHVVVLPVKDNVFEMVALGTGVGQNAPYVPLSHLELRNPVRFSRADVVESAPLEFDLPPPVVTLQMVKLPSGEMVHASANVLVFPKEGKVVYQDMAKAKLNLLEAGREDVPAATPAVTFTKNELTGQVKSIELKHFSDDTSLKKGERKLTVTWALHLQGEGIDRRLRVPFDIATGEFEKATADLQKVDSGDAAAVASAKADEAKTKAAKNAAETKYKSGLKSEREKLAKAFACGDVKIATNRGTKGPSNGKAAAEACKAIISGGDDAEVTITYTLDRYEIPIALVYSLGGDFTWSTIASAPLSKLDAR